MVNIWEYVDADKIEILCEDGKRYRGTLVSVTDAEEYMDQEDQEMGDTITVDVSGTYISFLQSEIQKIVRI